LRLRDLLERACRRLSAEAVAKQPVVGEQRRIGVRQPGLIVAQVEPERRLDERQLEDVVVRLCQVLRLGIERQVQGVD
jgi:hypothetical protein